MQEIHKELNDLAICEGRRIQSKETGFVHSFYGKTEAPYQAVSVLDNVLFVLALCRQKTIEGVQEGKTLLEKLLAYQNKEGFFPTYLHEFPFCYDRHNGAALLPPLFLIHRYFHRVLGNEISQKLLISIETIIRVSVPELSLMSLPNRFRLGGVLVGLGHEEGAELIRFHNLMDSPSKWIPKHLGEAFSGAVIAGGEDSSRLLAWMKNLWHKELYCYVGPFERVYFSKGNQELTLFDLYMIGEGHHLPARFKTPQLNHLKAAMIFPHELNASSDVPVALILKEKHEAISWISSSEHLNGRYPFAFQWGDKETLSSLILHAPLAKNVHFDGEGFIHIDMGACPELETKEPGREIYWFLTPQKDQTIKINGHYATTFCAGDTVTIEDSKMKIDMKFETTQGVFLGHLSKSCLPTEKENFGTKRFEAYQWQLLWRTISRQDNCLLVIHFSYAAKN